MSIEYFSKLEIDKFKSARWKNPGFSSRTDQHGQGYKSRNLNIQPRQESFKKHPKAKEKSILGLGIDSVIRYPVKWYSVLLSRAKYRASIQDAGLRRIPTVRSFVLVLH